MASTTVANTSNGSVTVDTNGTVSITTGSGTYNVGTVYSGYTGYTGASTITGAWNGFVSANEEYNGPVTAQKKMKIEGVELQVIRYSNYKIGVQELLFDFANQVDKVELRINKGNIRYFKTPAEAQVFIKRMKFLVKKMRAFEKQCNLDCDFI